ncbi:hypothetical protein [Aeromicrobium fastidiosum]|uniref:Lipoprotein n=1 Tax=Aeromicrobium fastidiosum TaxID=52699 RepID=A0A641AJ34_9ACTN|nr:hypothetical protein [Aeromicrobium fastidiosum]KAA1374899.1 hypothetical protein ESP62_016140 [Aeromicrobium fastidiosum]MBP2390530.1 hypothetical protein [Aeromicrobium fastidiosum]
MRRVLVLIAMCVVLAGCGDDAPRLIGATALSQQQDRVDSAAQRVVGALVTGMGAEPPSPDSLGRGLFAGCDNGDPDEAAYFVDTFVTYDVRPPEQAASDVSRALDSASLKLSGLEMTGRGTYTVDGLQVDLSSQEKRGGSAGQNIFVSTECLRIGKDAIAAFNAANGRDVTP